MLLPWFRRAARFWVFAAVLTLPAAEAPLAAARARLAERRFLEAVEACNLVLAEQPSAPDALALRAWARTELGDLSAVRADLAVAALAPAPHGLVFFARAGLRRAEGDLDGAEKEIERAIALLPRDADLLALRAVIRRDRDDPAGAVSDARAALALQPDNRAALRIRGGAFYYEGKNAAALADFTRLLALDPENAEVLLFLAQLHWRERNFTDASRFAEKAAAASPEESEPHVELGNARYARGDYAAAADAWAATTEMQSDPTCLAHRHVALLRRGKSDARLAEWLRKNADNPLLDFSVTRARFLLGQVGEAELLRAADSAVLGEQLKPRQQADAHYFIGMKRLLARDAAGAKQSFRLAMRGERDAPATVFAGLEFAKL